MIVASRAPPSISRHDAITATANTHVTIHPPQQQQHITVALLRLLLRNLLPIYN